MLFFLFFNDPATTEIYTLSLPTLFRSVDAGVDRRHHDARAARGDRTCFLDRKSTRLNSSHGYTSYAVFCLKKKTRNEGHSTRHMTTDPGTRTAAQRTST